MTFFGRKKAVDSHARRSTRAAMLRLRKWGLIAGLFALVGAAGFAGYHTVSFKKIGDWVSARTLALSMDAGYTVKNILVAGRSHAPANDILERLGVREGMPIFGFSIAAAQKSVSEISWVKEASISRRLPDTVLISLKERAPAALWQYQKKISVIDEEGVVLTTQDLGVWKDLPFVVGEDAHRHIADLSVLLKAEPLVAGHLSSAVRVKNRRWDLHLKNGIVVKLPEQDSELALRRLASAEEKKNILARRIAGIDLRQPGKLVVTPLAGQGGGSASGGAGDDKDKKAGI